MHLNKTGKTLVMGLAVLSLGTFVRAADFTIDPAHSSVGFNVRHIVSHVTGQFTDFAGTFSYDAKMPEKSMVDAVIQTKSVNTNNAKRDGHLQSPDFFDAAKFPTMTFKSTGAKSTGPGKLEITGNLTLHGVTKPVVLTVEGGDTAKDPMGTTRTGFTGKTTINRKDYGMTWNKTLDNGGVMVGEDVVIEINVEGVAKK